MLGTRIKSGAVKRIEDIAFAKTHDGKLPYSAFDGVRNKELVWSTLRRLRYTPNHPINPSVWTKMPLPKQIKFERQNEKPVTTVHRSKNKSMSFADKILGRVLAGERIVPDDENSRRYVISIMKNIRDEGHDIKLINHPSSTRVHYYQLASAMQSNCRQ